MLLSLLIMLFFSFSLSSLGTAGLAVSTLAICYMLVFGAGVLEDKNNSDMMLVSLPIQKKTIVLSKYVSVYVFAAYALLVNYVIHMAADLLHIPDFSFPFTLEGIIGAAAAVTFLFSISFPLIFKFGFLKSRMANFILLFALVFGGTALTNQIAPKQAAALIGERSDLEMMIFAVITLILLLVVSYFLSLSFYRSREF
jgi:hypothetical protein